MAYTFSKRDIDDIKPQLDKTIQKYLGINEPALLLTAENCLLSGYDKETTARTLSSLLDESKASKLTEKIFEVATSSKKSSSKSSRKRKEETNNDEPAKKIKIVEKPNAQNPHLSQNEIKAMMVNAQKLIEERKKNISTLQNSKAPSSKTKSKESEPPAPTTAPTPVKALGTPPNRVSGVGLRPPNDDKRSEIARLQANIKSKLSSGLIASVLKGVNGAPTEKPTPLILDSEGRTVDITGKEVQLTHVTPTLKANIRAKKREEFKAQFNQQTPESITDAHFFDPRIAAKAAVRNKRALRFHEPGKFQQLAERMRMKSQLEKLQGEIFQIAKKTGISSAAKMALIAPKTQSQEDQVPDIEWWDSVIAADGYGDDSGPVETKPDSVSNLVEHPTQMRPPTDPLKPVYLPVFLTKKERKKLRRQNRREAWKEEQEKIRLGLEPPPEPKLRISNLMRVLGTEAVQDPTKMEAHVRAQMAKRQKAHEDANASRKLTAEQRKEKKVRKLQEDTSLGVHVALYRVTELSNPAKKFKVETNAKQLFLTGCVVLFKDCNIVVVEGGPKQINKYNRLMMHRIKWEEDVLKGENANNATNKCVLVWKGTLKQRSFGEMKFKVCPSEKLARDHLRKSGVEHYWDLAYSGTVLDGTDDLFAT